MKVWIRTYGCQMNERDSEAALAMLLDAGHERAESEAEADLLIFNTCAVRDQAERKAIGKIGLTIRQKKENSALIVGVMGCMAQSRGEEILQKMKHVDFVIGTDQLHRLSETVDTLLAQRRQLLLDDLGDPAILTSMSGHLPSASRISASTAIMRGCSRHCSYCIVPSVRGSERSRDKDDILNEIRALTATGIREILLLGQNVAAYGCDNRTPPLPPDLSPFAELLEAVSEIPDLARIRFTSPHPAYFNARLIDTIATLPKVCRHVHLPVQSGSSRILKLMNRPYSRAHYLDIVNRLRERLPGVTFSTDIIVGFPGETDTDFEETRSLMTEVGYANAFIFKYSPRRDTPAATMPDQIAQSVKEARNQILLNELKRSSEACNRTWLNQEIEVLVEGPSKRNSTRWAGRTESNGVAVFTPDGTEKMGDLIRLRIDKVTPMTLFGTRI